MADETFAPGFVERPWWWEAAAPKPVEASLPDHAEVAIIAVNRTMAQWDGPPVTDADVVEFFPPLGGGSLSGAQISSG